MDLPLVEIFQCDQPAFVLRSTNQCLRNVTTVKAIIGCVNRSFSIEAFRKSRIFGGHQFFQRRFQFRLTKYLTNARPYRSLAFVRQENCS